MLKRVSRVLNPTAAGAGAGIAKATLAMKTIARLVNCIVKIMMCLVKKIEDWELFLECEDWWGCEFVDFNSETLGGVLITFEMSYFHEPLSMFTMPSFRRNSYFLLNSEYYMFPDPIALRMMSDCMQEAMLSHLTSIFIPSIHKHRQQQSNYKLAWLITRYVA